MALSNFTNSSNETIKELDRIDQITMGLDMYITPILYIIGFPGNAISLAIWLQRRMRHSSGYYLAALALDDLIFLALHVMLEAHMTWHVSVLDYIVLCEGYPVFFISCQILSPFLVLAFTTERYISVCHPFQREKYCTITRAKIVIICLVIFMLCLNAIHGYFWYIDHEWKCSIRPEVADGKTNSLYTIYTTTVDMLVFFVVPLTVLALNIRVIREMRRLSNVEHVQLQNSNQKTGSTTVMLLAVSFYQIITTLPISIAYALFFEFTCDFDNCQSSDEVYIGKVYNLVLTVIKEYGLTHYVFNIFIYIATGKMFRQELKKLLLCPFLKLAPFFGRDYTSLRRSKRGSQRSKTWDTVNGNNDTEKSTEETLL